MADLPDSSPLQYITTDTDPGALALKLRLKKTGRAMVDQEERHPLAIFTAMHDDGGEEKMFLRCFFIHKRVALTITASMVVVFTVVWTPQENATRDSDGPTPSVSVNGPQEADDGASTYLDTTFALTAVSGLGAVPFTLMTLGSEAAMHKTCGEKAVSVYPDVLIGDGTTFSENPGRKYHFFAVSDTATYPA
jgi:hypothetical protein